MDKNTKMTEGCDCRQDEIELGKERVLSDEELERVTGGKGQSVEDPSSNVEYKAPF